MARSPPFIHVDLVDYEMSFHECEYSEPPLRLIIRTDL